MKKIYLIVLRIILIMFFIFLIFVTYDTYTSSLTLIGKIFSFITYTFCEVLVMKILVELKQKE